ncbi:3-hexulose-6-phosphate synthase [Anaerobacillus isosaccharinicus]|uniref:3-hexulose-6-phosphate synthase n=1 Tax=Anaerobacillus isosaccharinicus TaxID=1532552 RepID=A0A1S2LHI2_9BACI|nr:3-hexulose-6-phosphate synthase [Anaerobacillus isosaccharinicus]MBA5588354.1 orotidine 5'-phosphate decarboxylase [Anaerobacillus isosaccharinicus]QOY38212.1 orotidine 5'-phosphate decarboxylase [Anaerobacillus isosaccharinicus]
MKIQLALDRLSIGRCFQILNESVDLIDWIEVGTGLIKQYGVGIIREIKDVYPDKILVADMKTCDAGKYETIQAFEAGADITTVMAFSTNKTILDSIKIAKDYKKRVMIDLLGMNDSRRLKGLSALGVDLVSLHFGKDMQQEGEIQKDMFFLIKAFPHFEVTVAGGINLESLPRIVEQKPDTIIIGSAITGVNNCREVTVRMKEMIDCYEKCH